MLFDLVILGMETAGLEVVDLATKLGQRVAIVHDPHHFGDSAPSGKNWQFPQTARYFSGLTRFTSPDSLEIQDSRETHLIRARRFVLACGTRPKRPSHIPFDGQRILDSREIEHREATAQSWLIVGAGEQGLNCARRLIDKGARVSLVDQGPAILDSELTPCSRSAWDIICQARCPVHWGTTILGAERRNALVTVFHENGSIESFGGVVFAIGRVGCTEHLNLPHSELVLDETQRVWCNNFGQTGVPHIYAVGSVVGFPRDLDSPRQQAARLMEHASRAERPAPNFVKLRTGESRGPHIPTAGGIVSSTLPVPISSTSFARQPETQKT